MSNQPNNATTPNAGGNAGEGTSGKTGVERLLEEFDTSTKSGPPQPSPNSLAPVIEFAQAEMQARQTAAFDADVKAAVEFISDTEDTKGLPERMPLGFLHAYAIEDPSFAEAWQQRKAHPRVYKNALAKAREEWVAEIKKLPTNRVRSDVEAAAAAVHGQTNKAPAIGTKSAAELVNMSYRDLKRYGNELEAMKRGSK